MPRVVNTVAGGPRPPFRKLWHIAEAAVLIAGQDDENNVYDKKL